MASKYTFTIPRRPDGRYYVQVIEQSGTYPLTDEQGEVVTFKTPAEAWDYAKAWEAKQAGG